MSPEEACLVNRAVRDALRDGLAAYEDRGVLVLLHLDATVELRTEEPALYQAVYTIFRGIPDRLAPGATLFVRTRDRAGGDIELSWEAREVPPDKATQVEPTPRQALRHGPYGDLLELALAGLESFCRVRAGLLEDADPPMQETTSFLSQAPHIRRRYLFLIPSLERDLGWSPRAATRP